MTILIFLIIYFLGVGFNYWFFNTYPVLDEGSLFGFTKKTIIALNDKGKNPREVFEKIFTIIIFSSIFFYLVMFALEIKKKLTK